MNKILSTFLRGARKAYHISSNKESAFGRKSLMFSNKEYSNKLIFDYLMDDKPCMITRFGATEMLCLVNYLGVQQNNKNWRNYIKQETLAWWWGENALNQLNTCAGFFPATIDNVERFCKLMISDMKDLDILGSWLKEENFFQEKLIHAKQVMLEDLEPFFCSNPWTTALAGKKVLVVHPFAETIEKQYEKRSFIFEDNLLPDFTLKTIKAVQSAAGEQPPFDDWFQALESMKNQIDNEDYDICIIGCGAYGFPLAAHVKRMGKKAVHLGGVTQLLFGIKGKRWEDYNVWHYQNMFNEYWVRPDKKETPKKANIIEEACYW